MNEFEDLTGKMFGYWLVLGKPEKRNGDRVWLCRCTSCNKIEKYVYEGHMKRGNSNGCIKCSTRKKPKDITGKKYNTLTAIKRIGADSGGRSVWLFKCDCGNSVKMDAYSVTSLKVKSCGECNHPKVGDKSGKLTITKVFVAKNKKASVLCKCECGRTIKTYAYKIQKKILQSCGTCKVSRCENKIAEILDKYHIEYIRQKKFEECKNKRCLPFDFYLPRYNSCLEFNGEQHYRGWRGDEKHLVSRKKLDKIKKTFCKQNNINLWIISYLEEDKIEDILVQLLNISI